MKKMLLLLLVSCSSFAIYSQNSEIGPFAGTSFYIGDLNPTTLFANPKFSCGIVYRYNFDPRWALKANVIFSAVAGSDAETNDNYERNLSFRSPITEISVQAELNFLKLFNVSSKNRFAPYIFAGIGIFSFNPQAEMNGTYYYLQHLGTEGQGLPGQKGFYSLCNVAIPFGIGLKWNITQYICLGVEWGMRYTFTDYLDDVGGYYYDNALLAEYRGELVASLADRSDIEHAAGSGRGNVTTKDLYSFLGAIVTFRFGNSDRSCDIKNNVNLRNKIKMGKKH